MWQAGTHQMMGQELTPWPPQVREAPAPCQGPILPGSKNIPYTLTKDMHTWAPQGPQVTTAGARPLMARLVSLWADTAEPGAEAGSWVGSLPHGSLMVGQQCGLQSGLLTYSPEMLPHLSEPVSSLDLGENTVADKGEN